MINKTVYCNHRDTLYAEMLMGCNTFLKDILFSKLLLYAANCSAVPNMTYLFKKE